MACDGQGGDNQIFHSLDSARLAIVRLLCKGADLAC